RPAAAAELTTAAEVTPLVKSTSRTQVQQGFQPRYLANVAPSGEQVEISLSNSSTWRKFSRQNTEMIVTKANVSNFESGYSRLDPAKKYEVYVTLMLADRHTLKYQRGVWLPNGQGEVYPPPGCTGVSLLAIFTVAPPPTSRPGLCAPGLAGPGKHWTRQEVAFMRLKLTNKLDCFRQRTGSQRHHDISRTACTSTCLWCTSGSWPKMMALQPPATSSSSTAAQQQQLHVKTEGLNAPKFQVEQQPSE
uniref:T-box domain-containing protein n=1 Tax=Macrostomum lignano TaxID=282301 RepID=A0A1I8JPG3_9PLAT